MRSYSIYEMFYSLQGEGLRQGRPAVFVRTTGCNLWSGLEKDRNSAVCQFCDTQFVGTGGLGGGKFRGPKTLIAQAVAYWQSQSLVPHLPPPRPDTQPTLHEAPIVLNDNLRPYLVFTGGEPLLQVDSPLVEQAHRAGFEVAIETNGTLLPPPNIDWITVSPKANAPWQLRTGNELKLIFPQKGLDPMEYYQKGEFEHYFLQPLSYPFEPALPQKPTANPKVTHDATNSAEKLSIHNSERLKSQLEVENMQLAMKYCLTHPQFSLSTQMHKQLGIR